MHIKPKKKLGQNFLIDKKIIKKIISIKDIQNCNILEIGPGTGNLTELIIERKPSKFFAIEKDDNLSDFLRSKFKNNVEIFNEDILKFDLEEKLTDKFIVFGNLPYNISTEIICSWILKLNKKIWFSDLILMFQKEVAERIIAKSNSSNYGRLSILSNWRLNIEKIFDVSPNCFYPKPKVNSSVLHFTLKNNFHYLKDVNSLELVTRVFFSKRRKMIKHPLKQLFENYKNIGDELKLDLSLRPQNLEPEVFYEIANKYSELRG